ncbi:MULTISPECIES: hypothetical protein [Nostocales]|uniref:Uncharacterized protein n=1 Tax=Tolypothrix bouteillei VB521301 TaxID=1479485 RepID=A0A0C1NAZ2_9CYAN
MNSSVDNEQQHQFLEAMATRYGFFVDTWSAFLKRFARGNLSKSNASLVQEISWNSDPMNKAQKLQEELQKIYKELEKDGCPRLLSSNPGRSSKNQNPWQL